MTENEQEKHILPFPGKDDPEVHSDLGDENEERPDMLKVPQFEEENAWRAQVFDLRKECHKRGIPLDDDPEPPPTAA
ncbi:hypothetical protein COW95_01140 [Candidatus Peregrinibacteria bacterium CG22_combo_CG10-13_8_21_14_all_49_11]|nr:MAG: hypothetical protein COW95_01140 [Candidatus Peregrinibacteria bacterium CG22_combo_CG10-13_8_21_14_all_49_11]